MAESPPVGVVAPNLFVRAAVDAAIRGVPARPIPVAAGDALRTHGIRAVVVDLDALGADPGPVVARWVSDGVTVLAFAPHVDAEALRAARAAGAIALPRSVFLSRLPDLLDVALGREVRPRPRH